MKLWLALIVAFAGTVGRAATTAIMYEGTDVSSVVAVFGSQVHPLKRKVFVYNWSGAGGEPYWKSDPDKNDSFILKHTQDIAGIFWQNYGNGNGNMYGMGVYAAVDPVVTRSYGGGGDIWLLLQMEFPKGFRLLDLTEALPWSGDPAIKTRAASIMTTFGCPAGLNADSLFTNGGSDLSTKCRGLVARVFRDSLQIDGFAYSYSGSHFDDCSGDTEKAFVITGSAWMRPDYIRYFSAASRKDVLGRRRIQSIFSLQSGQAQPLMDIIRPALEDYLANHEDANLAGSKSFCGGATCILSAQFCDSHDKCEWVPLGELPRPGGPRFSAQENLLWPDLAGELKLDSISKWVKKTKYACSGLVPYDEKPDAKENSK